MRPQFKQEKTPTERPQAAEVLASLLGDNISLDRLDQIHDMLRLLGVVMGQMALLDLVSDTTADAKSRVSAARALTSLKEDPNSIAERLRRSPFAGKSVEELQELIKKVSAGGTLHALLKDLSSDQVDKRAAPQLVPPEDIRPLPGAVRGDAEGPERKVSGLS